MANNFKEQPKWEEGIYKLKVEDPVLGGEVKWSGNNPSWGHANVAASQLANRTRFLRDQVEGLANGVKTYETKAEMDSDTSQDEGTYARVINDEDDENNGYYSWDGSSWSRTKYQPATIEKLDELINEVETFPFQLNQLQAQINAYHLKGMPIPSFYQEFGGGASMLDPRITFSRSGTATYIKNGKLLTAGVDEPVFENGGLRLEPLSTNRAPHSEDFSDAFWEAENVTRSFGHPSPDGGSNACLITSTTALEPQGLRARFGGANTWNYSVRSLFIKSNGVRYVQINYASGTNSRIAVFDIIDGKVAHYPTEGTLGPALTKVERLGGGWVRIFSDPIYGSTPVIYFVDDFSDFNLTKPFTSGDGVIGAFIWGHNNVSRDLFPFASSYIPTEGGSVTRPADNASIQGAAFQQIFNPTQGALILPHSSFSEGSIITLWGLNIARTEDGLELNNTAIPDTEDAKQNLKLRWGSNGLDVFVGDTKALHDIPLPSNWGDADSLVLADNDSAGKYIDRLAMLTEAPTDSNMEGM